MLILSVAVFLSFYHLSYNMNIVFHGYGDGSTAEIFRLTKEKKIPTNTKVVYIQSRSSPNGSIDAFLDIYGFTNKSYYMIGDKSENDFTSCLNELKNIEPPFLVANHMSDRACNQLIQDTLSSRFPQGKWIDSDPGKEWSLSYFGVN
jgi:hypothetical protein